MNRRKATSLIAGAAAAALTGTTAKAQIQGTFINVMTGSEINNADIIQFQNYQFGGNNVHGCCAFNGQTYQLGVRKQDYPKYQTLLLQQTTVNQNQQIDNSINDSFNETFNDSFNRTTIFDTNTNIHDESGSRASVNNCP